MDANTLAWIILLLPLLVAASILLGVKRMPGLSALLSTGSVLITLVCSILLFSSKGAVEAFPWITIGDFNINIGLKTDDLAKGMMFIVTFIGTLVHVFSLGYMKDDEGKSRYFAGLSIFMFSMTGIVLADNFAMMFIFWELVGVSSYILIGHWFNKDSAADAAKKAFLTNRIGDFGFMIGILLIWVLTGFIHFDEIAKAIGGVENAKLLNIAVLCVFCGAVGKSAQLPLHVWLPDAMEGPTPVSALIHAATMVAAGVYMLARVSALIGAAELAANVIMVIGAVTALFAALMALQQNDIKRILAYSTLSQLGYMVIAQGLIGEHSGSAAGMFHLYTHAFFKALLFLGAGAVIYACHHQQDIWKMGGLRKKMPITFWTFVIGTAALIAVPGTSGFFSKEAILHAAHEGHHYVVWTIGLIVALLTPFYMTRLVVVAFFGKPRDEGADHAKEVPVIMWVPLAILAFFAIFSAYHFMSGPLLAGGEAHFTVDITGIISLIALIAGAGLAIWMYRGKDIDPVNIPLFANKFYVDEIYAGLIAFCQDMVASILDMFDRFVVDPFMARFPAAAALSAGSILRFFQVGNLQGYTFMFGAGVIALIWFLLF